MENFKTTNFKLACFLRAKRIELCEMEFDRIQKKCTFVFEDSKTLKENVEIWNNPDTDFIRDILFQSSVLKNEIRELYMAHNN